MFNWLKKTKLLHGENATESISASITQTDAQKLSINHKRLGDERLNTGATDEAARHYREAIAIDPNFAEAHNMLGDALRGQGKLGEAAICYRKALEAAPNLAEAHYGLGVTLLERSDSHNATVCFNNALRHKSDLVRAHNALGFANLELGKPTEALACFQKSITFEPENGMALHLIASLTGSNPERPPGQYIEKLFDGFANTFDTQLQQLKYETPKNLLTLIAQVQAPAAGKWNVLDLGCGTGLVGLEIAPYARRSVGVDLSAKMLEKAGARSLYHRLEHLDLMAMMNGEKTASYDMVIAADTLIYLGKLDGVVSEVRRLLCPGGFLHSLLKRLRRYPIHNPVNCRNWNTCFRQRHHAGMPIRQITYPGSQLTMAS